MGEFPDIFASRKHGKDVRVTVAMQKRKKKMISKNMNSENVSSLAYSADSPRTNT